MEGLRKYIVTITETHTVWATDEQTAEDCAYEAREFPGYSATLTVDVEAALGRDGQPIYES